MWFIAVVILLIAGVFVYQSDKGKKIQEEYEEDEELSNIIQNYENNNYSINLKDELKIQIKECEEEKPKIKNKDNETDNSIPNNINEITNNQYEVLTRLDGANIRYALTGIINSYHTDLPKLVEAFKDLGVLRYSNLEEAIQKMTIKELKECLRNKRLKLTGNKKELIERLLPSLEENEERQIIIKNKCYVLTDEGKQILQQYKNLKYNELKEMFIQSINLFKAKMFESGYKKICEYNAKYNNICGINFNWKEELHNGLSETDKKVVEWFMNKEIELDSNLNTNDFKAMICYTLLSGESFNDVLKLIKDVYNCDEDVSNIQYYNIMISNEREALDMENLDIEYYEILGTDNSCSKCKSKTGRKFKLSNRKVGVNFPPLCKECRCTIVSYFDD